LIKTATPFGFKPASVISSSGAPFAISSAGGGNGPLLRSINTKARFAIDFGTRNEVAAAKFSIAIFSVALSTPNEKRRSLNGKQKSTVEARRNRHGHG
jgi:hypothetical protein